MGRPRKYANEEERIEARRASKRKYDAKHYQDHKVERAEYHAKWYQEHKTERAEHKAKYRQTKEGRACHLINRYKQADKKYNRGNCDLTVPWFIRNIFNQRCYYCGESDWRKLGCDRINNSLPHTMENVVPCCNPCNNKRGTKPFEQFYWESKHETLGEES